jgi:hypothetical protein
VQVDEEEEARKPAQRQSVVSVSPYTSPTKKEVLSYPILSDIITVTL